MTDDQKSVLAGIADDVEALRSQRRPYGRGQHGAVVRWLEAQEGIVRTRLSWAGLGSLPHERMRFTRLLDRMERAGLIIRLGWEGGPKTHVALTDAGRAALAEQEAHVDA